MIRISQAFLDRAGADVDISSALHVLAHELRGSVAVIQGYARMLAAGQLDDDTSRHILKQIQEAASRVASLGNETAEVARWLDPKVRRTESALDLAALVDRAVAKSGLGGRVSTDVPAPMAAVMIRTLDADALTSAIAAVIRTVAREMLDVAITVRLRRPDGMHCEALIGSAAAAAAEGGLPERPEADASSLACGGLGWSLILASVVLAAHGAHLWSPVGRPGLMGIRLLSKD